MAILKDLIVHGSSRFLNKIYASEIQTPLIEAEAGIFKKLKADNATVVGLLDVQGQMHTNSWTNSNIATIDGSFYITPTLSSSSGTVSFSSAAAATFTGTYSAVSSLYVGNNTASTVQWTSGSKILITGQVQVDGEWIPLGTLLGTLNSTNPTTSMPVVSITDNRNNPSTILADIYSLKNNTSLSYRNLKVSLYQRADNQEYYPLGIFMTALGQNGKTFLDIYGGVNSTETASYEDSNNNIISNGGYADPNVRIGNLSGLAPITTAAGNFTPVGWGIYTTNGYFSGTIVSNTGVIGGWKLGANSLYNGTTGLNNTTAGIYLGTDGIRNYKDTDTYVNITEGVITAKGVNLTGQITATSGTIGGASITNGTLIVGNANISDINASKINAGDIAAARIQTNLISAINAKVNDLSALTATIGGFQIDSSSVHTKSVAITSNADNSIALSSTDFTRTINNTSRTGLRFAIGDKFGITGDGTIYASNVDLTGKITATSGTIGGIEIVDGALDVSSISIGNLNGASNYAQKTYVTQAIDNIEVGGRNLLKGSDVTNTKLTGFMIGGTVTQTIPSSTVITLSVQVDADDVVWESSGHRRMGVGSSISKDSGGTQYIEAWAAMTGYTGTGVDKYFDTSFHGRIKSTYTLQGELPLDKAFYLYIQGVTSGTVSVSRPKLEIGNKATDWTPAPEDTQENINNVSTTANVALNQSVEYIKGTQTAATASWTGVTTESSLRDGKIIMYYLPYKGASNVTLNLTLSDNTTTGAIPVYLNYSTSSNESALTRVSTHYPAGSVIQMTYDGVANQWKTTGYNTNVDHMDRTQYALALAANMAISAGRIAVLGLDGKLQLLSTASFDITCPPLYVATAYSAANVTSATTRSTNYNVIGAAFTLTNTHSIQGAVAHSNVYIVGTLSGEIFTPTTNVLTCTEPTTEDGLYYMLLGKMITTSNALLQAEHPIYIYKGGKFQKLESTTATSYITQIDANNGIRIHTDGEDKTDYLQINSDAISMYRNNVETLKIEDDSIRIGKENEAHLLLQSTKLEAYGGENNVYFVTGDAGNKIQQVQIGDGSTNVFYTTPATSLESVTINGTVVNATLSNSSMVTLSSIPPQDAEIIITYYQNENTSPYFMFGERYTDRETGEIKGLIGPGSVALGSRNRAAGFYSVAEGFQTEAIGYNSHSQGSETRACGVASHVEGIGGTAYGRASHVEGSECKAYGFASHAGGQGSNIQRIYSFGHGLGIKLTRTQTFSLYGSMACGQYNFPHSVLFGVGIGEGDSDNQRKNAFSVGSTGNCFIAGTLMSGTPSLTASDYRHMFYKKDHTFSNLSVPANNKMSSTQTKSIEVEGYTPIAVSNYGLSGTNAIKCFPFAIAFGSNTSGSTIIFNLYNTGSSAATIEMRFTILYIATAAL